MSRWIAAQAQVLAERPEVLILGGPGVQQDPLYAHLQVMALPGDGDDWLGFALGAVEGGRRVLLDLGEPIHLTEALAALRGEAPALPALLDEGLVVRVWSGGAAGAGSALGETPEDLLVEAGVRVLVPTDPESAAGLLASALDQPGVTVLVEALELRNSPDWQRGAGQSEPTPLPLEIAHRVCTGAAATLLAWGGALPLALEAGRRSGAEVFDLRTLFPLDAATVCASIARTGRAAILTTGARRGVVHRWLGAISEGAFWHLKEPVQIFSELADIDPVVAWVQSTETSHG